MLILDHIFACTSPETSEAERLRKLGFTVEFSREHPGQGTANRLVLFEDNYLELLFVQDLAEAEASMVRLDRRVDWRETGASPFGVALRGDKASAGDVPWVHYTLPGFPAGLWIDGRTLDDPSLPLLFVFDRPDFVDGGPKAGGYPPRLLRHECGATRIERVVVSGPGLASAPTLPLPAVVSLTEATTPALTLVLAGTEMDQVAVGPLLLIEGVDG